jgi:selenide,water dikinase
VAAELRRLVLLGGGHAHCEVLARFARRRSGNVELVLVSPAPHAIYSGMVPGWIAGDYRYEDCRIDLDPLATAAGALRIEDRALALDADARRIVLQSGREIDYDLLSIDVGSTTALAGLAGAAHGIALRPIEQLETTLIALDARARSGALRALLVVGAGAAGVEVLLALRHRLARLAPGELKATLVADSTVLLPDHGARARRLAERTLARLGVHRRFGVAVRAVTPAGVQLADGTEIAADAVILATGAAPHPWLAAAALARDARGFVAVDDCLRSSSHPGVYGAGDAVTTIRAPKPKAGVYAVRQGPVLAHNLMQALGDRSPRAFACPAQALAIFNTGGRRAIASWRGLAAGGHWVWRWKDGLDRRFMARYAKAGQGGDRA